MPCSGLGTVTYGKPFHLHHTHFPEEETGSREAVQLRARSAGQGYNNQDVPASAKCRRTAVRGQRQGGWGRLVQDLGSSGWRTGQEPTVWRNGSELELQAHELTDALQRPAR